MEFFVLDLTRAYEALPEAAQGVVAALAIAAVIWLLARILEALDR